MFCGGELQGSRRVTRPGGVVVAAIHTVRSTMNPLYTVALGELRSRFDDWEILIGREDHIAEVVARKPSIGERASRPQ